MSDGFARNALVYPTTQEKVHNSVVTRLRDEIPVFSTDSTCFTSDTPWPYVETEENLFCTVSPGDGTFDPEMPVGAGQEGIRELSQVNVTVWSRLELDRLDRTEIQLTDADRGLMPLKRLILRALAGRQLFDTDGVSPLLVEWMRPTRSKHPPSKQHNDDFATFMLSFECVFDWDLR